MRIIILFITMRLLFNLYCDSSVQRSYSASIFPYVGRAGEVDDSEALGREDPLPVPSRSHNLFFDALDAETKKRSYKRFYKALTAHWIAVEALWLARTQVYETVEDYDQAFGLVWTMWTNNPARPIEEKIDLVEVVDFVWGFLGRKTFHVSSVPTWLEGQGEEIIQQFLDDNETEASEWLFFVRHVAQFLRPPDIIELLLSMWALHGHWQLDRPGFLRRLGVFDSWQGIIENQYQWSTADPWLPLTAVEEDVENGFHSVQGAEGLVAKWTNYRQVMWPSDARAKVLFRYESARKIIEQNIDESQQGDQEE